MLKSRTFTGHDLQHVSRAVASEESQLVNIADALGHKTLNMTRRYAYSENRTDHTVALLHRPVASDPKTDTSAAMVWPVADQPPVF
jgi:integrase